MFTWRVSPFIFEPTNIMNEPIIMFQQTHMKSTHDSCWTGDVLQPKETMNHLSNLHCTEDITNNIKTKS